MDKGNIKDLNPLEITRNLTTHGSQTLNPIPVFTRGVFATHRDGKEPFISTRGVGGSRFIEANSLNGLRLEALEDDSEYHCILPREKNPRFWKRSVKAISSGKEIHTIPAEVQFLYVADGSIIWNNIHEIKGPTLLNLIEPIEFTVKENTVIAMMWIDEPSI